MATKNLDKGEKEDSIRLQLTSHTAATCASPCLSIIIVVIYMCAPSMQWGNRAPSIGGHILRGHHLRYIQVGGRCLRNWTEAGDRSRPSGRRAAEHLFAQTRLVLVRRREKLYSWLTMPPITDDPSSEGIEGRIAARRAVPLQSSRVDEEAVAVTSRRASCAGVDANRLPARVSGVGQCEVHAPTLLVSLGFSANMGDGCLTKGIEFRGRILGHSSGPQPWTCSSHSGERSVLQSRF